MSIIHCPDCNEENFASASFCKRCAADFNRPHPFSRILGRTSAFKNRSRAGILLDLADVLEDFGGPWGMSVRLTRPTSRQENRKQGTK